CKKNVLALLLQIVCELTGESRLTRTLQAGNKDDRGISLKLDIFTGSAHQSGEFVACDFGEQLTRRNGGDNVLTHRLLPDFVGNFFGYLVVDVGIDQRLPDFLDR